MPLLRNLIILSDSDSDSTEDIDEFSDECPLNASVFGKTEIMLHELKTKNKKIQKEKDEIELEKERYPIRMYMIDHLAPEIHAYGQVESQSWFDYFKSFLF